MNRSPGKARILIVEDEYITAAELENRLGRMGYDVCGKTAGYEEALALVRERQPDLVLMDIVLKGQKDGLDAASIIRSRTGTPVVFLTAHSDLERLERAGTVHPFGYLLKPCSDDDLRVTIDLAINVTAVDAERRRAEEALRLSRDICVKMIDGISTNIVILDENGIILHVNRAWRDFAEANGPPASAVCEGADYLEIWEQTQRECSEESRRFTAGIRRLLARETDFFTLEYPCKRLEKERWFLGRAHACPGPGQYLVIIEQQDITEQRSMMVKLRESKEKYRQLYTHAPVGIYEIDLLHYRLLDVNDIACRQLGYSREELLEMNALDLLSAESRNVFIQGLEKFTRGEKIPEQIECEMIGKNGRRFWGLMTARFQIEHDKITGASVVVHDITKRKLMEDLARKNEERFRLIVNHSVDSAFFHDKDMRYIWITKAFVPFTIERILGKTDLDLLGETYGRKLFQFKKDVLQNRTPMCSEFVVPIPVGGRAYYEIACSPRTNLDGRVIGISGFMRDITARRQAEEEIQHREALLQEERKNLEEANTAFKLLLKHRDEEKNHLKEDTLRNIKNLVLPYFERLKSTHLDRSQRDLIEIIENSLESILPGYSADKIDIHGNLTPKELEVAHLVRMGHSSRKISKVLNISDQTVAFHRKNIRKKLGLDEKNQNLRAYLLKLSS